MAERADDWSRRGAEHSTDRSPEDGRPKAAAWVRIAIGECGGQLTAWDSGEGELDALDAEGRVAQNHYDDLMDSTVRLALDDLEALIW